MLRYSNPLNRLRQKVSELRTSPDYHDWVDILNSMETVYGNGDELHKALDLLEVQTLPEVFQKAIFASDKNEKYEEVKDSYSDLHNEFHAYKRDVELLLSCLFQNNIPKEFNALIGKSPYFDHYNAAQVLIRHVQESHE